MTNVGGSSLGGSAAAYFLSIHNIFLSRPTGTRFESFSTHLRTGGRLDHRELRHTYVFHCVSCITLALLHTFARVQRTWSIIIIALLAHILAKWKVVYLNDLAFTRAFMFCGVESVWFGRFRSCCVFHRDLYGLRDLYNVFWVGSVRSSS